MTAEREAIPEKKPTIALVLDGGGARGAYQAGMLKGIADYIPTDFPFRVITGTSAGAINAACIAASTDSFRTAAHNLVQAWLDLDTEQVFKSSVGSLSWSLFRWVWMLTSGGLGLSVSGLFDTRPLHHYLNRHLDVAGIDANIQARRLHALALTTTCYSTGQTVSFVHGVPEISMWQRARRTSVRMRTTIQHVMASAALPLLFPAIQLPGGYFGDGSLRMSSPFAPAIHLGADRLLAISLRYDMGQDEESESQVSGYPPPAQILGMLMHGVFLDALESDAERLKRINRTISRLPPESRHPDQLRPIDLLMFRPSQNLGKLAQGLVQHLPYTIRTVARGLGSSETSSPDFLSYLLFERPYIERLIELGYHDACAQADEIQQFLGNSAQK